MGERVWDWFLPIRGSMGDGVRFEYNKKLVEKLMARARKSTGLRVPPSVHPSGSSRPSAPPQHLEDS
jgi:hypothetical protein